MQARRQKSARRRRPGLCPQNLTQPSASLSPSPPPKTTRSEERFYIHCDGALFGMMMPFIRSDAPVVTFAKPIGSVSVSGHKVSESRGERAHWE